MAGTLKELTTKLRDLGLKVVKTIEKGVTDTRKGIENSILEEELRHRFNLENPYRFEIRNPKEKANPITGYPARNAKRYLEDDLFVFYGAPTAVGIAKGDVLRDLSDDADFQVEEIVAVTMVVSVKDVQHDVPATAAKCRPL